MLTGADARSELAEDQYPGSLFMNVEMLRAEDRVRLAALTRDGHEPLLPQWWFTDNALGVLARIPPVR